MTQYDRIKFVESGCEVKGGEMMDMGDLLRTLIEFVYDVQHPEAMEEENEEGNNVPAEPDAEEDFMIPPSFDSSSDESDAEASVDEATDDQVEEGTFMLGPFHPGSLAKEVEAMANVSRCPHHLITNHTIMLLRCSRVAWASTSKRRLTGVHVNTFNYNPETFSEGARSEASYPGGYRR